MGARNKLLLVVTTISFLSLIAADRLAEVLGTPGTGDVESGLSFAIMLLIMRGIMFALLVYAILKGYKKIVALIVGLFLASAGRLLIFPLLSLYLPREIAFVGAIGISLSLFTDHSRIFKVSISIAIGAFISTLYTLMEVRLFTVILAMADAVMTLKGPMKVLAGSIVKLPESPADILMLKIDEHVGIGLGDLIVYAALPSSAFINVSHIIGLLCIPAALLGVMISLEWASRRGIVPALPIPVALMSSVILMGMIRNSFLEAVNVVR